MNKATVFPLSSIDEVIEKQQKIINLGELDAEIYMLTITEEKYTGKK